LSTKAFSSLQGFDMQHDNIFLTSVTQFLPSYFLTQATQCQVSVYSCGSSVFIVEWMDLKNITTVTCCCWCGGDGIAIPLRRHKLINQHDYFERMR